MRPVPSPSRAFEALKGLLDENARLRAETVALTDKLAAIDGVWEEIQSVTTMSGHHTPLRAGVVAHSLSRARNGIRVKGQPILAEADRRPTRRTTEGDQP